MTGLETVLPALGYGSGLGVLLYLAVHLARSIRVDRNAYLDALKAKQAELEAEQKAHDDTQHRLDVEREARRGAEDKVAELARRVASLEHQVEALRVELGRRNDR